MAIYLLKFPIRSLTVRMHVEGVLPMKALGTMGLLSSSTFMPPSALRRSDWAWPWRMAMKVRVVNRGLIKEELFVWCSTSA